MADPELFPADLIDKTALDSFPNAYVLRPLSRCDYHKGFFECLQALTWTGDVSEQHYHERFDWMRSNGKDTFYVVVVEHKDSIIGTGALLADRKFIWGCGIMGHIEDVSIREAYQGKGLGKLVIHALTSIARNVGCRRVVLNCSEEKKDFYSKCGYGAGGLQMHLKLAETPKE